MELKKDRIIGLTYDDSVDIIDHLLFSYELTDLLTPSELGILRDALARKKNDEIVNLARGLLGTFEFLVYHYHLIDDNNKIGGKNE